MRTSLRSMQPAIRLLLICMLLSSSACSFHSQSPSGSVDGRGISKKALSMVGKPYVYGGASPKKGFDCSGLVCWAYGQKGVPMPRTAKEQSKVGAKISKKNLKPGDVVVFRISSGMHTGIYTGKGRFVHSPGRGKKVRIDDVNSQYWSARLVNGRRHGKLI